MSFDGVFLHHLLEEIKPNLINQRINRIHSLDYNSFVFILSNKLELLIDLHPGSSHLRFTKIEYTPTNRSFPLFTLMKKNLERGRIINLRQVDNDRILIFEIASSDEMGFPKDIKLVLEFFGRNSNLFLLDEEDIIIDCLKKSYLIEDMEARIILPKVKYELPDNSGKINPFKTNIILEYNHYQGVSNLLYPEIVFQNNLDIINNKTEPVLIKTKNKYLFYCFNLKYLNGDQTLFPTLSDLLESYYMEIRKQDPNIKKELEQRIQKENLKIQEKLRKQEGELKLAKENLELEKVGNLLSANLHRVLKSATIIEVDDFYSPGKKRLIKLDPLLSPAENLEYIYGKYKKAKRTIVHLEEQIKNTKNEIRYWQTLSDQLNNLEAKDLKEIANELKKDNKAQKSKKIQKPQITKFKIDPDTFIMVGKNNLQNNYLTHSLAKKNDYFFHVKDSPGSHTILRCKELSDELITLAAMIAAYYSKSRNSSQVPVDYTQVKNLKKVAKTKGSFVTYTKYKTAYVTPNLDLIKSKTN